MSERKRGILTAGERRYLQESPDFGEYTKRSRIREHTHSALLDGTLLYHNLPEEDREQIFDPLKSPNVDYDSPLEGGEDKGEAKNRADIEIESVELERSIADLLAFIYEGLIEHRTDHGRPFDAILQNAIHRVERRKGWVLEEYEFKAEFDKSGGNLDRRYERFKNGEATMDEATLLLQQDMIDSEQFTEYAENYEG